MNCSQCRTYFSDYLDKVVTPIVEREMRGHLAACGSCTSELRAFKITSERLRGLSTVAPPGGLAASVTSRLLAAPAPRESSKPAPAMREREPAWPWATLAAAGLLIGAASFFAGHLVNSESSAETATALRHARSRVEGLETELRGTRTKLVEQNAALRSEIVALRSSFDQWKIEHTATLEAERETRRALDRRLENTTRQISGQEKRLAVLQSRLDTAIKERDTAATANEALERRLASVTARATDAEEKLELTRARRTAGSRQPAIVRATSELQRRAGRGTAPVLFVREGNVLSLKTRGSLEEIVPRLFAVAESGTEPEFADLALTTLESRLKGFTVEKKAEEKGWLPGGDQLVGWFNRQVGNENTTAEEPVAWGVDRRSRLAHLRRVWRERIPTR